MAILEIVDEGMYGDVRFQLYIDGSRCAAITKTPKGPVQFVWQVHGPQYWPQAKQLLQGLIDLSVIADQLTGDKE
jgi:hypothetical protein